jgi:uncharacterized membrane protein YgdD (TMEM256/DUF423 family)
MGPPLSRLWIALGGLAGCSGVGMAAYAAHGLPGRIAPEALAMVQSAVAMQLFHALALTACGIWAEQRPSFAANLAAGGFAFGILGFCGALYARALGGTDLGLAAPAGGISLIAGWVLLGLSALNGGGRVSKGGPRSR